MTNDKKQKFNAEIEGQIKEKRREGLKWEKSFFQKIKIIQMHLIVRTACKVLYNTMSFLNTTPDFGNRDGRILYIKCLTYRLSPVWEKWMKLQVVNQMHLINLKTFRCDHNQDHILVSVYLAKCGGPVYSKVSLGLGRVQKQK